MTQTVPWYPKLDPATGVQQGAVYGYNTLRVDRRTGLILDGTIEVGYVGQTIQELAERDAQHRGRKPGPGETVIKCQPFSDILFGEVFIIEIVPIDRLDEREQHHIERLKPAYNHQLQTKDNPNRIQISEARRHRDARDAAKGLEPRAWPAFRNPPKFVTQPAVRPAAPRPARKPARLPARWRRRRNRALGWLAGTGGLWLTLTVTVALLHYPVAALAMLPTSAGAVTLLYTPWLPRRRQRRTAWLLIVLATLALTGATLR